MGRPIALLGCRHDVLGHALKTIGTLRALAQCAPWDQRDPNAEGWWDLSDGCFRVALSGDRDEAWLQEFFEQHYVPTPIIAAWNKSGGITDKLEVVLQGDAKQIENLRQTHCDQLKEIGLSPKKKPAKDGSLKFAIESGDQKRVHDLVSGFQLNVAFSPKQSGKKDGVIPEAAGLLGESSSFRESLALAREFAPQLQTEDLTEPAKQDLLLKLRDRFDDSLVEAFDALSVVHLSRIADNPLFLKRGRPGDKVNADIFLNFWEYFLVFKKNPADFIAASLLGERVVPSGGKRGDWRGKGTPFFPDAIKTYNHGLDWVTEELPFCPLDYLLAVEGALAMRGATSKSLAAQSRARGAFPFVFDTAEAMVDEQGKELALASAFWFPIWERSTTFAELQSFILDAQARLLSKDCRFSTDFARAIVGLGVDGGFTAFQEFKFKLKAANVPWTTAGRLVRTGGASGMHPLLELLGQLDEARFLEQLRFDRSRARNLHPLRVPVFDAIDVAVVEPTTSNLVEILCRLADLNRELALSKKLRGKVSGTGYVSFVPPLPWEPWESALRDLEGDAEFQIARALASMIGHEAQRDGKTYSEVEPFLGSVLPLKRGKDSWYLQDPPSAQAVWAGADLCQDLANVLARRHQDSISEDRPALLGSRSAPLSSILAFLRQELDDRRIARLSVALGHIGWCFGNLQGNGRKVVDSGCQPIPTAYAALRSLIEVGLEQPRSSALDPRHAHRRSPGAIALLCQRTPHAVAAAVGEALRRLAVVGVPNCYDEASRFEKSRLCGRDVISLSAEALGLDVAQAARLAAAVLVPLDFRDRWKIFRAVTLPQTAKD